MAESILFNSAGTILAKLGSLACQELALLWGVVDELEKLKDTVSAVEAVLLDAEQQQLESHAVKDWVSKLKDAFYDIDDLIDEFSYETLRRQVLTRNERKGINQVRIFFSKPNIAFRLKMGHKIKEIRERLKAINDDKTQFSFSERLIDRRYDGFRERRETGSYIPEEEVIGRDDEKKEVLDFLLNSTNTLEDIVVVSIVGMGGLGKTALAQSIYNHTRMANQFQLKIWVCVSEDFSVKVIIRKIIESASGKIPDSSLEMDSLQKELKSQIDGKKYLLVMDDVWNEKKEEWFSLKRLLMGGAMGSRILITTSSEQVAKTFETAFLYSLKYLDECNAWTLFQKMTRLERPEEELRNSNLVQIGKEIVLRLKGVPLVIRIIGLLKDKKSEKFWLSFKDKELYQVMGNGKNDIEEMRLVLELSYKHLPANLKQCFLYCALFPKDYKIKKDELILQWRAQGFIRTNDKDELNDLGEDYFMELLSMSFFQEVTKDELGNIKACKMHDLACSITENECVHGVGNEVNKRTHHFSMGLRSSSKLFKKLPETLSKARNLRTFFMQDSSYAWIPDLEKVFQNHLRLRTLCCLNLNLWGEYSNPKFGKFIGKMKYLRHLSLSFLCTKHLPKSITELYNLETFILERSNSIESLPSGIKNLVNLKYFDLSWNENLELLPNSITELCKLEALIIRGCKKLKEFPLEVKSLIKLKHLDLSMNENIEFLPDSITKLCELEALILRGCKKLKELPRDVKDLINLKHLDLSMNESIEFLPDSITELRKLETLKLGHCRKLKGLPGDVKNWVNLRHLDLTLNVKIEFLPLLLCNCTNLKELPKDTKKLINLKHLNLTSCLSLTHMPKGLGELTNLQTMNSFVLGRNNSGELSELNGLNKLRGDLSIQNLKFCTSVDLQMEAKYLQQKSGLQKLVLHWANHKLFDHEPAVDILDDDCERVMDYLQPHSNLQEIRICRYKGVKLCNWLSSDSLGCLITISLDGCERLQHLPRLDQFPYLKYLYLRDLPNIRYIGNNDSASSSTSFPPVEELRFPCLSTLEIHGCPLHILMSWHAPLKSLKIGDSMNRGHHIKEDEFDVVPWKKFENLSSLGLFNIRKLEYLPQCLQHVTTLQFLTLGFCENLKCLPQWIGNLTSLIKFGIHSCEKLTLLPEEISHIHGLESLTIWHCPKLGKKHKKGTGEDWPKIAHISEVVINEPLNVNNQSKKL